MNKVVRFVLLATVIILISTNKVSCLHKTGTIPTHEMQEDDTDGDNNNNNNYVGDISGNTATGTSTSTTKTTSGSTTTNTKIPFLPKNPIGTPSHQYQDPFAKGFEITTRVYTDLNDKLAHFDDNLLEKKKEKKNENDNDNETTSSTTSSPSKAIVLPYWECGVAGSTTVPVPISTLTVRHLLGHQSAGSFTNGCGRGEAGVDDTHPRLVVALTPLEIVLNSNEKRIFYPGDVILFENCLLGGHILQGHEGRDMIAMMLTLPHPYHHVGKERNSLSSILNWKQNPCKTGLVKRGKSRNGCGGDSSSTNLEGIDTDINNILAKWTRSSQFPRRRLVLGVIGGGLSLVLADFLGKVAPIALAVAAGGGLVAAGGAFGFVKLGEYGLDELDFWRERRLLRLQDGSSDSNDNSNDDDGDIDTDTDKRGSTNEREYGDATTART
jgi:hypothetical protein